MDYFYLKPEVAGSLGADTVLDRNANPPVATKVQYELESWRGDSVLESYPVFIVTEETERGIIEAGLTGAAFDEAEVTKAVTYQGIDKEVPPFRWLKPVGEPGRDDIAQGSRGRMIVSARALAVLEAHGIEHGFVKQYEG
jgi:hypothetical protein